MLTTSAVDFSVVPRVRFITASRRGAHGGASNCIQKPAESGAFHLGLLCTLGCGIHGSGQSLSLLLLAATQGMESKGVYPKNRNAKRLHVFQRIYKRYRLKVVDVHVIPTFVVGKLSRQKAGRRCRILLYLTHIALLSSDDFMRNKHSEGSSHTTSDTQLCNSKNLGFSCSSF